MSYTESRQKALIDYLNEHFESGKFITIEEICRGVVDEDYKPYYKYNTNPYNHDKCAVLSSDVRDLNWNVNEGCQIIVKDPKGNVKLCESEDEFKAWRAKELEPLDKKWKYLNNLVYKSWQDGATDLFDKDSKPKEVFKKDTTQTTDQSDKGVSV